MKKQLNFNRILFVVFISLLGFATFSCEKESTKPSWITYSKADGNINTSISSIAVDADDNIWFGGLNHDGCLTKFDGTNWTNYDSIDNVMAIAIDDEGNKWLGINGGYLTKFDDRSISIYDEIANVSAIAIDKEGNKWLGNSSGIVEFDGKDFIHHNSGEDMSVSAIAIDKQGNKWIGTYTGVVKFDGKNWTKYTSVGWFYHFIIDIAVDKQGNVWAVGSGVSKFDGENWTTYTKKDGLNHIAVSSVAIDAHNNKWFGTQEGATKFDGQKWTRYTTANGLGGNYVNKIAIDKRGNKWFGTVDKGVTVLRD